MTQASDHPAYNASLARAAERAFSEPGECYSVYFDGEAIYVRNSAAAEPANAQLVCIAQWWDERTAQLRFPGARSEWRVFPGVCEPL